MNEEAGAVFKIACPHCSVHVEFPEEAHGQVHSCPSCGLSVALVVPGFQSDRRGQPPAEKKLPPKLPLPAAKSEDETILSGGGVTVTRTRLIVQGTTYPIAAIGSLKTVEESPGYGKVVGLIFGGVVCLSLVFAADGGGRWFLGGLGILLLGAGVIVLKQLNTIYHLVIVNSAQEVQAYSSYSPHVVREVESAVHRAISERG